MEQLMIQGFNTAGPLLMVSIQKLAINALLHNVEKSAYEAVRSPATEAFKVNPYQDTMMDYLFDAILMRRRPVQRRDSLYDRRCLANRQSGYQQPTRTSYKRFQDSHSSSTRRLSLGSCSYNSGRSRASLNLFDNQDMDEQDKDEPDDRPGTSYNWCNRRSRPTFNFGLHKDDNEEDEEDDEDDPAPRPLKARQTSTPYLSANQRAQSFAETEPLPSLA